MIEEEDGTKPLTDDQIAKKLDDAGIHVTRARCKISEDMRIPALTSAVVKNERSPPCETDSEREARSSHPHRTFRLRQKAPCSRRSEDMGFYCVDNLPVD